ncbi:MAG: citrate synthase, partial [Oscillospiraceae bacterium]|nr:citrate synthase [Oscillospiraceae bacterium]
MEAQEHILTKYMPALCADAADRYAIDPAYFARVHRGLRNDDGTGVMIGATRIGSVRGYTMDEGERIPMDGQLYYRGISVSDLVQSHWENDTFGYEE